MRMPDGSPTGDEKEHKGHKKRKSFLCFLCCCPRFSKGIEEGLWIDSIEF